MTGEVAVTLGAEGQGMVAGDLVNTASRVQSAAEPGMVLVGEATRRATEAAVIYQDAGAHALKGKAGPVPVVAGAAGGRRRGGRAEGVRAWRHRSLAGSGAAPGQRSCSTRPPRKPRPLVSVAGIAGIGKSPLAWEFEKYIDGLSESVLWHRGAAWLWGG